MRLLLFADLHLEAAFAWAGAEGARRRRQAIRDALDNIVALVAKSGPDAVLCAGDLYEQERVTPDTGAFLRSRLGEIEVPVYIAPGNHDYFGPRSLYAQVDLPSNVTIFDRDTLTPVELAEGVRLWGAAHCKPAGTDGFFEAGFSTSGGAVDLALFHGSEAGALSFEGDSKSPHAPFRAEQIERAGLRHAFVGHFHTPAEKRLHTYPGNPQPLTFGEQGRRGAVMIEVEADGSLLSTWHSVEASPAHDLEVDLSAATNFQDARELLRLELEGKRGVARVRLVGDLATEVELDSAGLREVDHDLDAPPVVDASGLRPAYDLDAIAEERTVRGRFVRDVRESTRFADEADRRRVLVTGLRALEGRDDLEVPG